MDFSLDARMLELQARTRAFIADEIVPMERDPRCTPHGPDASLRADLVAKGRKAGLLSSHVSPEWGGLGLDHRGKAIVFEEAGYSPLGPGGAQHPRTRRGQHAPAGAGRHPGTEGAVAASPRRGRRALVLLHDRARPRARGSDPSMLETRAKREGDQYVIDGRKWFITGADGAGFAIIMAREEGGEHAGAATMFLADMDRPGIAWSARWTPSTPAFPADTAWCA
jgi:alkylation response protein AidB-like acyl-CoA dehydrogenase